MANALPLQGKVARVTGGGVRLGRALAEGLGQLGADLAVHHHGSEGGALEVVERLVAAGRRAQTFGADLRKPLEVQRLAQEVERVFGRVDILINSAALFQRAPFLETSDESLEAQWELNARAPFLLSRALASGMVSRRQGDIINVVDIGGARNAWRGYAAYGMTKAALASLTECLALELAPHVRVNGVAPGTVLPPVEMTAAALSTLQAKVPLKRFGTPQDVVDTAAFLLTGPSFITGQIIAVDGGRSLDGAGR